MSRTQRWTCSWNLEVHITVSAQISAFLPDDTIFLGKYETICPVFKNHLCSLFSHLSLPRRLSTNTVFLLLSVVFPITVESQHNFLRHRDLSRDLLTVSSIRRSEVENATFWSAKNMTNFVLAKVFFPVMFHTFWTIEKREKNFRFSGTLTM